MNGKSGQKVNGNSGHEHYNRTPDSVLYDKKTSLAARCIYAVLAGSVHQGTVATMGQRRIATRLGIHQETVSLGLQELAVRGHITIVGSGKARRFYHLHSDVFGSKQRALNAGADIPEEYISQPRRRLATVKAKTA